MNVKSFRVTYAWASTAATKCPYFLHTSLLLLFSLLGRNINTEKLAQQKLILTSRKKRAGIVADEICRRIGNTITWKLYWFKMIPLLLVMHQPGEWLWKLQRQTANKPQNTKMCSNMISNWKNVKYERIDLVGSRNAPKIINIQIVERSINLTPLPVAFACNAHAGMAARDERKLFAWMKECAVRERPPKYWILIMHRIAIIPMLPLPNPISHWCIFNVMYPTKCGKSFDHLNTHCERERERWRMAQQKPILKCSKTIASACKPEYTLS